MRRLPVVRSIIAAPCDVPWTSMHGDHRKRHCDECKRDVHNLSAMTENEVSAFLEAIQALPANQHAPCVSVFERFDGTVLTADCPVGVSRRKRRALLTAALGIGGVAVVAVSALAMLTVLFPDRDFVPESMRPQSTERVAAILATPLLTYAITPNHRRDPDYGVQMAGAPPPPPFAVETPPPLIADPPPIPTHHRDPTRR